MLAPSSQHQCIVCGLPYGSDRFHYWEGIIEHGPAYWSDRGLLCSPACSASHYEQRRKDGTLPDRPVPDPFEQNSPVR